MGRAGELIESIRDAAGELSSLDLTALSPQELGGLLQQVEAARARVDAAANAVLDRFDAEGAAAYDGLRTTSSWLRQRCQMTGATASRRVRSARAMRHLPEVADGFRAGRFSADQVDLFARNHHARTADAMAHDESALAALADRLRPDDFARELRGWAEMVDTDGAEPDPGHRGRSFSLVQTLDDTWTGRLDLSSADGLFLHGAVEAMAEALYRAHESGHSTAVDGDALRPDDGPGPIGGATTDGTRSRAQRRADALLELVRRGCGRAAGADAASVAGTAVDGAADARASARRRATPRVNLYLTIDAGDLEGGRGADTLDGHHLGVTATDRLLCDAAITAVLRDPFSGAVLNFGRSRRVVTPAQRAALALRDGGCSFPGCTAPPEDCDAHHIVFWRNGGRSDIDNLTLACWATHHPLVHEGGWHIVAVPDGRPRWLRPDRSPVDTAPGWDHDVAPPDEAPAPSEPPRRRHLRAAKAAERHGPPDAAGPPGDDERDMVALVRARAHALRAA